MASGQQRSIWEMDVLYRCLLPSGRQTASANLQIATVGGSSGTGALVVPGSTPLAMVRSPVQNAGMSCTPGSIYATPGTVILPGHAGWVAREWMSYRMAVRARRAHTNAST